MRLFLTVALASAVVLSGCAAMAPVVAPITIDEKGPVAVGDTNAGVSKVGRAKAQGLLIVAWGDASISTAAASAGITKIHHVDNEVLNILGIYAKNETIVYGE